MRPHHGGQRHVSLLRRASRRRTLSSTTSATKTSTPAGDAKDGGIGGGYKSFGSFHSDDVEEIVRLPGGTYAAPDLPFDEDDDEDDDRAAAASTAPAAPPRGGGAPFANSLRHARSYPHLDREGWTFLNHGAFGLGLGAGLRRAESWREYAEAQPLRYFDRHLLPHAAHAARGMVDFVTTDEAGAARIREGAAMVQNVTSGMNAVVGGHRRGGGGSSAFYYDISYGSTKKICGHHHGVTGNAVEVPFEEDYLPLLRGISTGGAGGGGRGDWDDDAAEVFISALDSAIGKYLGGGGGGGARASSVAGSLLILDHITSNTAIRLPISSIARHAKEEHGMVVAVDGAHALWSLPLDAAAVLSAGHRGSGSDDDGRRGGYVDAYLTNCHKWFSSPRGAALLLCADPEIRDSLLSRPAVISHGADGGFLSRFMWDGCRDYSAQLALPAVLDYWNAMDIVSAREEVRANLREGVRILSSHWHPDVDASCLDDDGGGGGGGSGCNSAEAGLTLVPLGMHAPTMALVRLPDRTSGGTGAGGAGHTPSNGAGDRKTSTDAKRVQDFLYGRGVEVPVKCVRGVLYARVSCHLYNTADEFERLGRVALKYAVP